MPAVRIHGIAPPGAPGAVRRGPERIQRPGHIELLRDKRLRR